MTSTPKNKAFYLEYEHFVGRLLQEVSDSLHHAEIQPAMILPELAGLWVAAGAALGMKRLLGIVALADSLKGLFHDTLALPEDSTDSLKTQEGLALLVGTVLHRFRETLEEEENKRTLSTHYSNYLERLERTFDALRSERVDEMINEDEHKKEIEGLYLQSFYMLTRLSRM
jgi:hypothetical protein